MLHFQRNYEDLAIIGRGAYGTVFKARDVENERIVALKRIRISQPSEEKGVPVSTLREITLLKQLDNMSHPNIVRFYDTFQTQSVSPTDDPSDLILTIVFEHVEQDLSSFLRNYQAPQLPESLVKNLMYQLLKGIDHLHTNRMVHRDIKPQNVLITKNNQVKIADFGLARIYGFCKLVTSVVVTLWYRAPEVLLNCPYATLVDMWSVGAIMVEMYNRRPLFPGKSDIDQLHKVFSVIGAPGRIEWPSGVSIPYETFSAYKGINFQHLVSNISMKGIDLLKKLLVFNVEKRYNAYKSLSHSYFDEIVAQNCISNLQTVETTEVMTSSHKLTNFELNRNNDIISENKDDPNRNNDIISEYEGDPNSDNIATAHIQQAEVMEPKEFLINNDKALLCMNKTDVIGYEECLSKENIASTYIGKPVVRETCITHENVDLTCTDFKNITEHEECLPHEGTSFTDKPVDSCNHKNLPNENIALMCPDEQMTCRDKILSEPVSTNETLTCTDSGICLSDLENSSNDLFETSDCEVVKSVHAKDVIENNNDLIFSLIDKNKIDDVIEFKEVATNVTIDKIIDESACFPCKNLPECSDVTRPAVSNDNPNKISLKRKLTEESIHNDTSRKSSLKRKRTEQA